MQDEIQSPNQEGVVRLKGVKEMLKIQNHFPFLPDSNYFCLLSFPQVSVLSENHFLKQNSLLTPF